MSGSTLGKLFTVTSFGESHGPAIGCVVDGCPPGMVLSETDIQPELDRRKPGTSRHVTQRHEEDRVEILSGVFEGRTTGTPIGLLIRNVDARSKDYSKIKDMFRRARDLRPRQLRAAVQSLRPALAPRCAASRKRRRRSARDAAAHGPSE